MDKNIHNRVEAILNSIDNIQRADAPPFFATRLNARIDKHLEPKGFVLPLRRPALVLATLLLLLIMNIALLTNATKQETATSSGNQNSATLQGFATEYNLNASTTY